jgi:hypothetical protein
MTEQKPVTNSKSFRWLPRHGNPRSIYECISQNLVKLIAYLPVYTAIVVTLVLVIQIFGLPFVEGSK